ncbi:MAG: hypothetical protein HYX92_12905 [Chloroflexi bacterium]|nr:hypothetical protein [Chloroflexota bacterium]
MAFWEEVDNAEHVRGTGKGNELILSNLARMCQEVDTEYVVRLPLISGYNDDDVNVRGTAEYVSSLKRIRRLDILGFNELPGGKFRAVGLDWEYKDAKRQSDERLEELKRIVESCGLTCSVGGLW